MKTKSERGRRHVAQLRTGVSVNTVNRSANREQIVARGGKIHKIVKAGGKKYFIELKKTR